MKSYNYTGDSKYELMLKRLLEQKKIERKGPKRRKTLRANTNTEIKNLIENVIIENVNKENEKNKSKNKMINDKRESILLNYKDKKKIKNNFDETEITSETILNDIRNINNSTSNYISDANYICKRKNFSPKKE